jgi:guanylate kinase
VEKRLACFDQELAAIDQYDYVVVNDLLADACRKVTAIITAEEARADRDYWRKQFLT